MRAFRARSSPSCPQREREGHGHEDAGGMPAGDHGHRDHGHHDHHHYHHHAADDDDDDRQDDASRRHHQVIYAYPNVRPLATLFGKVRGEGKIRTEYDIRQPFLEARPIRAACYAGRPEPSCARGNTHRQPPAVADAALPERVRE
jgi:hypothetical protein